MKRFLGYPIVQNVLSLYAVQIATYLLPVITVPYLARVLHPEGWGLVIFAQSFALWIALVLEYGFRLSTTREIARYRGNKDQVAEIVASVLGAKGVLLIVAAIIALVSNWVVPIFHENPQYLWLAWISAVAQGLSPFWYFQGLERMQIPALLDVGARVLATAGIFIWVKTPDDGWKVLGLQGVAAVLASGVAIVWMYCEVPLLLPRLIQAWSALHKGWTMFLSRSVISLYTVANAFILGLFVSPTLVGYYGGAERISSGFLGLVNPISQALYPRMNYLMSQDQDRAAHLARRSFALMGGVGIVLGVIVAGFAPLWIAVVLGPGYDPSVPVLRVLALLVPLIALSNVLGIQWMLPLGMDRTFVVIVTGAGLLNVGIALLLAPRFGPLGMAWTVVFAEIFVTLAMCYTLYRSGHVFWKGTKKEQ